MLELIQDIQKYIKNFEYDLIVISDSRICFINQFKNIYIEISNIDMVFNLIEYMFKTSNNFKDCFKCDNVIFSNDYYLKNSIIENRKEYIPKI